MQKLWPNVGRKQMKRRAGQMSIEVGFQAIYVIRINHVESKGHSWVCWSMKVLSENYMPADKCLCENPFVTEYHVSRAGRVHSQVAVRPVMGLVEPC